MKTLRRENGIQLLGPCQRQEPFAAVLDGSRGAAAHSLKGRTFEAGPVNVRRI